MKLKIIALFMSILVFGCATAPKASQTENLEAKKFVTSDTESTIYIFRTGTLVGAAISFEVSFDGKLLGTVGPNTFHMVKVEPGNHSIAVTSAENTDFENITTTSGENYFFKVHPKMGVVTARTGITMVTEEEGMKMVRKGNLLKSMLY